MDLASLLEKFGLKSPSQLFKRESRFLGVDIGTSSIKLIQLRKERERAILETYGELSLAKYGDGNVSRSVRLIDTKLVEALKVLLAAVPKETVSKYKSIFDGAGFAAAAFEIEVFSFARAALKRDFGAALLMDIGASSVKMTIADGGVARASHSFDRGSQEL